MAMTFNSVHADINHQCIDDNVIENTTDIFMRALGSQEIKDADFQTQWERGEYGRQNKQRDICMRKGLSVTLLTKDSEKTFKSKLANIKKNNPRIADRFQCYCKIIFKDNAGKIWHTPSKFDADHHTFFKCDTFMLHKMMVIEMCEL